MLPPPLRSTLFPYTTLFRSPHSQIQGQRPAEPVIVLHEVVLVPDTIAAHGIAESLRILERRSEEHTSELQSRLHLVCRLLLEKKKKEKQPPTQTTRPNSTSD